MKRGIERKQAEVAAPVPQAAPFILDALTVVTHFLPSYSLMGTHAIHNVSKEWNQFLKHNTALQQRQSKASLIASCQSREDCLNILRDENLFQHLSINELLSMCVHVPEIIDAIINGLNGDELVILGKTNIELARRILDTPHLAEYLGDGRCDLVGFYVELAEELLDSDEELVGAELAALAQHFSVAECVVNEFFDKLDVEDLFFIFKRHPAILLELFCEGALIAEEYSQRDLIQIALNHEALAQYILNTGCYFSSQQLITLGLKYPSVAFLVLSKHSARLKLEDKEAFVRFLVDHGDEQAIQRLISVDSSILKVDWIYSNFSIFKRSLLDDTLSTFLFTINSERISRLLSVVLNPAFKIIFDQATSWDDFNAGIIQFQLSNPKQEIILDGKRVLPVILPYSKGQRGMLPYVSQLLKSPDLKKLMNSGLITHFAMQSFEVASLVLRDPDLYKQLDVKQLRALYQQNQNYKNIIHEIPELSEKLGVKSGIQVHIAPESAHQRYIRGLIASKRDGLLSATLVDVEVDVERPAKRQCIKQL